jgi:hypothetical protein
MSKDLTSDGYCFLLSSSVSVLWIASQLAGAEAAHHTALRVQEGSLPCGTLQSHLAVLLGVGVMMSIFILLPHIPCTAC